MNNRANTYSSLCIQTGVENASPHRLIQMLFNGALERIAQAKGAMQQKQIARKGELIGKAVAIIGGLQGALVETDDSDLTKNLDNLYDYMIRRLTQANLKNDVKLLDEVTALIREIKEAWDAIEAQVS